MHFKATMNIYECISWISLQCFSVIHINFTRVVTRVQYKQPHFCALLCIVIASYLMYINKQTKKTMKKNNHVILLKFSRWVKSYTCRKCVDVSIFVEWTGEVLMCEFGCWWKISLQTWTIPISMLQPFRFELCTRANILFCFLAQMFMFF